MKNQKKHLFQENITRFFTMFQWSKIILLALIAFSIIINQFSPVVYAHAETTSSVTSESTQSTPLISSESASMSSTTSDIQGVDYATTTDEDYSSENIKIIEEDRSLRTETTKTFLKEDGSYALAIYGEAIHYEEDGVFKDIDNTLYYEKETDSYQNTANRLQLKFPKNLDHHAKVQLSVDDYDVAWMEIFIFKDGFNLRNIYEKR